MKVKKITALVPIKQHSSRVPNKNFKLINGKPLYYYIIISLTKSKYIKKIIINTDSDIIKSKAPKLSKKIIIYNRPKSICGDLVSMNRIIKYDVTHTDDQYYLQTHTTNPLLTTKTINQAIEIFFKNIPKKDSLFSVTRIQTRLYDDSNKPINHDPKKLIPTQNLPPVWEENSNLYIFTKKSFLKNNNRIGNKPHLFPMNEIEAIDIDNPENFLFAQLAMKLKK